MSDNPYLNPKDGINSPHEHKNFAMLVMGTVYADGAISVKRVKRITGLDDEHALALLRDLESDGVLKKNSVSKFEAVIDKADWYERSYTFYEKYT